MFDFNELELRQMGKTQTFVDGNLELKKYYDTLAYPTQNCIIKTTPMFKSNH